MDLYRGGPRLVWQIVPAPWKLNTPSKSFNLPLFVRLMTSVLSSPEQVQDTAAGSSDDDAVDTAGDSAGGVMTVGGSKDPRAAEKLGASHLRMTRQNRKST